jgi:hypothetical protein
MSDGVKFSDDWRKAQKVLATAHTRIDKALNQAVLREAHRVRNEVVKGITSGAPAGQRFARHSPITLLIRKNTGFGGTKVLIGKTGALRASVIVVPIRPGAAFVGVKRKSARGYDIARLHEFGRTYRMKPGQRRFIFAHLKKAGRLARPGGSSTGGGGIIRVPPRPFFGPIVDNLDMQAMKRRIEKAIMAALR